MSNSTKKIIIAPLNWGLGHATRCIPIIQLAIDRGHEILLASDGTALRLLQKEFPALNTVELPSYDIHYASKHMAWNMIQQLPKIQRAIHAERNFLKTLLIDFKADLIISDNRYGCYHTACPSVIICHQLNIPAPSFIAPIVDMIHHRYLAKFNQVWIPDYPGNHSISGKMTSKLGNLKVKHIGLLSRFDTIPEVKMQDQIICVLSGPEPQRSKLEIEVIQQLSVIKKPSFLIQGQVYGSEGQIIDQINNLTIINYLTGKNLNRWLQESKYIIARSGYSTIMDLLTINRSALLVPTPGQSEQEYLAQYLSYKKWMICQDQKELDINQYLKQKKDVNLPTISYPELPDILAECL